MKIRDRIVEFRRVPAGELQPNPRNWRTHPKAQQDAMRGILAEIGYAGANLAYKTPEGGLRLIDGHLRAEIMPDQEIPTLITDLTEAEANLLLASYDPLAAMAEADKLKLDDLLKQVDTGSEALQEMFADLAKDAGLYGEEVTQDEVPEPPKNPVTQPGDLWLLGEHRLLCGDSTKAEDVGRLLGDRKPFIMVTDPPYGVEYEPSDKDAMTGIRTANSSRGVVSNDDRSDWTQAYRSFAGSVAYVWHGDRSGVGIDVGINLRTAGFVIRCRIIWRKSQHSFGRGHYHWQHESAWYAVRKGETAKWVGDATQSTVWDISNKQVEHTSHGTQKPVECMARPIRNHGGPDDDVYDPFLGSGTTIIAAEQLNRRCYGLEIDPAYCDVIVERWEKLTGGKAKRESVATNGHAKKKKAKK